MTPLPDPLPNYSFYIEIKDKVEAAFTDCSGLNVKRDVWSHQEGGLNDYVHTRSGILSYANITLKQGVAFSDKLWKWFQGSGEFITADKRDKVSIIQCTPYEGTPIRQYDLEHAIPVSWSGPDLSTKGSEVAVESIEIMVSRITIQHLNQQQRTQPAN